MSVRETTRKRELASELVPEQVLPKVLNTFDLVAIYVYIVFFINASAIVALGGWPTTQLWILGVIVFLIPAGMAVAELGNVWPAEGGVYVWAAKTLSPAAAFFAGYLSWVPILLVGATHPAIMTAFLQLAFNFEPSTTVNILLQLVFLWVPILLALGRLRTSRSLANAVFVFYMVLVAAVIIGGIIVAARDGGPATPFDAGDLTTFNLGLYGSFFGLVLLNYLGVEAPFNMGAEVIGMRRRAIKMVVIGSIVIVACYMLAATGILLSTPLDTIDPITGAVRVFDPLDVPGLIPIASLAVIVAMLAGDMTYQSTYSRLIFVSGLERHLPRIFTHLNPRTRNPVTALVVSGAITSVIIVVVYAQQSLTNSYLTLTGALVMLWLLAGLFFFIPLPIARRRYQERYEESFWRIPGGMAGIAVVLLLGVGGTLVGMYYTLVQPYSADISKGTWMATVGGVSGLLLLAGVLIFVFGKRSAEKLSEDESLAHLATLEPPEGAGRG